MNWYLISYVAIGIFIALSAPALCVFLLLRKYRKPLLRKYRKPLPGEVYAKRAKWKRAELERLHRRMPHMRHETKEQNSNER